MNTHLILGSLCLAFSASAATFIVANTNDSGAGSLRQAILDSNAQATPTNHVITFNIPGQGLLSISVTSALPALARSVTIDGFSQPNSGANTLSNGNNAQWMIELDGSRLPANQDGFELNANNIVMRGLRVARFKGFGIDIGLDDCSITGCFIYSNNFGGVRIDEGEGNRIGGASPADRNVISGNLQAGIVLDDHASSNSVFGNFIGTDVTGTTSFVNQQTGVQVFDALLNTIGGTTPGEENVIAFNTGNGIEVMFGANNSLRGNRIFSNGALGIDLSLFSPGVSTNDPGDGDFGPNNLQNYPVITNVVRGSGAPARIQGWLNSAALTEYTLDFYSNTDRDSSGHGEGEFYSGAETITTDANGNGSFDITLPTLAGSFLTVTATDPFGSTSEFSPSWLLPLRLELARIEGALELFLEMVNGAPIVTNRLPRIRVLTTTNVLVPVSNWQPLPRPLEWTNGRIRVSGFGTSQPAQYFLAAEEP